MKKANTPEWERLQEGEDTLTDRMKVYGGWVLKYETLNLDNAGNSNSSMVFIPDGDHEWDYVVMD